MNAATNHFFHQTLESFKSLFTFIGDTALSERSHRYEPHTINMTEDNPRHQHTAIQNKKAQTKAAE